MIYNSTIHLIEIEGKRQKYQEEIKAYQQMQYNLINATVKNDPQMAIKVTIEAAKKQVQEPNLTLQQAKKQAYQEIMEYEIKKQCEQVDEKIEQAYQYAKAGKSFGQMPTIVEKEVYEILLKLEMQNKEEEKIQEEIKRIEKAKQKERLLEYTKNMLKDTKTVNTKTIANTISKNIPKEQTVSPTEYSPFMKQKVSKAIQAYKQNLAVSRKEKTKEIPKKQENFWEKMKTNLKQWFTGKKEDKVLVQSLSSQPIDQARKYREQQKLPENLINFPVKKKNPTQKEEKTKNLQRA